MRLMLLGPPGSGKGTYAQMLEKEFHIPKISTGDILREYAKKGDKLGNEINSLIIKIVNEYLSDKKDFILDGFPRTLNQAKGFNRLEDVIYITSSEKSIIERLMLRVQCERCHHVYNFKTNPTKKEGRCDYCNNKLYRRSDETPKVIKDRLKVYERETFPLVKYYKD